MRTHFRSGVLGAILLSLALIATGCGGSGEDIDVALLFSTQPVIDEKGFVALEDDQGMIPAENIVPVVSTEVVDAYGDSLTSLVNSITAEIETQTLLDLNGQVELEEEDPSAVARGWLEDNDLVRAASTTATATEPTASEDGPTITVASFNFPESVILAEIYAQAMESEGYPVEKRLDLGSRELILPELRSGAIDFLPEYVGSALGVGFGGEATADTEETLQRLKEAYQAEDYGVTVLEPAPGQDKNVFVVTQSFAEQHNLQTISDLANVDGTIRLGGPPECENRDTCLVGLRDVYGLDNVEFEPIQETSARVAALEN